ncbi:DUF3040 domain-containing protein [Streptomyces ficellus]|uniref:DUF3040 domain-containing protein n=1 Tax=Streptomyces ficellus TaxID=1977088 RepID=A0A6I6FEL4_9ACTN|nr:DUF3040 domain-containing protein [Streptomyces ficellus]QGV76919.1 DUF3040 domain-containing protein [Streptomyces ficellus]
MEHESEGRILAQIERGLTSEDPDLAARLSTLSEQVSGAASGAGPAADPGPPERHWRRRATIILVVIALVGLVLTVVLNASSYETPTPPSTPTSAAAR